jgi:hypothetical protein
MGVTPPERSRFPGFFLRPNGGRIRKRELCASSCAKRFPWCLAVVCGDEPHFSRSACAVPMNIRGNGWSGALRGKGREHRGSSSRAHIVAEAAKERACRSLRRRRMPVPQRCRESDFHVQGISEKTLRWPRKKAVRLKTREINSFKQSFLKGVLRSCPSERSVSAASLLPFPALPRRKGTQAPSAPPRRETRPLLVPPRRRFRRRSR